MRTSCVDFSLIVLNTRSAKSILIECNWIRFFCLKASPAPPKADVPMVSKRCKKSRLAIEFRDIGIEF